MTSDHLPEAVIPSRLYPRGVPVPTLGGLYITRFNEEMLPYLVGAAKSLVADSTWRSSVRSEVQAAVQASHDLLNDLMTPYLPAGTALLRQSGCDLQVSYDDGATWTTIYTDCTGAATQFILRNPVAGENVITAAEDEAGLSIVASTGFGLYVSMNNAAMEGAGIEVVSTVNAPSIAVGGPLPLVVGSTPVFLGDGTGLPIVRGSELSLVSANERAFYIKRTTGFADQMHLIGRDSAGALAVLNFQGPTGATGATGATGDPGVDGAGITSANVFLDSPLYTPTVSLANDPDIQHQEISFTLPRAPVIDNVSVTDLEPGTPGSGYVETEETGDLLLNLGVAVGATGATGATGPAGPAGAVNFPALPSTTEDPIDFWMIVLPAATLLPWIVPSGYTVEIIETTGLWRIGTLGFAEYHVDAFGTSDLTFNGMSGGSLIWGASTVDANGLVTPVGDYQDWQTPFVTTDPWTLIMQMNTGSTEFIDSYIVAHVRVTPTALTFSQLCACVWLEAGQPTVTHTVYLVGSTIPRTEIQEKQVKALVASASFPFDYAVSWDFCPDLTFIVEYDDTLPAAPEGAAEEWYDASNTIHFGRFPSGACIRNHFYISSSAPFTLTLKFTYPC
jgi:hypothetical protein